MIVQIICKHTTLIYKIWAPIVGIQSVLSTGGWLQFINDMWFVNDSIVQEKSPFLTYLVPVHYCIWCCVASWSWKPSCILLCFLAKLTQFLSSIKSPWSIDYLTYLFFPCLEQPWHLAHTQDDGLDESGPHRLIYLNPWSSVDGTVPEGWAGVALLKEVCP